MARPVSVSLAGIFVIVLVIVAAPLLPGLRSPVCATLARLSVDAVSPACTTTILARAVLDSGRAAVHRGALREALSHFRAAAAAAPDLTAAQLAHGDIAETLGEYTEALGAYRAAARIDPSVETNLRVADIADRLGDAETALRAFEAAYGTPRQHQWTAAKVSTFAAGACVTASWSSPAALWQCGATTRSAWRIAETAARDVVPQYIFQILLDSDRRDEALAFARDRGWVRDDVDHCTANALMLQRETAALLAMLTQPDRADCVLPVAVSVAENGGARMGRRMLADRIARSTDPQVQARAAAYLRYRLPAHDVSKLAEALNATGWRLQNVHNDLDEALAVFHRAIEADPRFSWPYHNIGRLYLARKDNDQALAWLAKALEVNPNHQRAQFNYGVAAARLHRHAEALAAYQKALAMTPEDAHAYANIGWTLISLGREDEGTRALQTAVRMDDSLTHERDYLDARFGRDPRGGPTPFSPR